MQNPASALVSSNPACAFAQAGFFVFPNVLSPKQCDALVAELTPLFDAQQSAARTRIGGVRNLLHTNPLVAEIARSAPLLDLLRAELSAEPFPVRSIFFDKNPETNWAVPWHQDLHIAVTERIETTGFSAWSVKAGVPHVQPPTALLERMVTLRLHLDDCDASNGALKVIPGSHAHGVLTGNAFDRWQRQPSRTCEVPRGGVLLMRPLLLHASSPATNPRHRRVLHLEYALDELPNSLKWHEQIRL